MALTDIEAVRLKTSDQPVRRRENWTGDGVTSDIKLEHDDLSSTVVVRVWKDTVLLVLTTDYTLDLNNGLVSLVNIPPIDSNIVIEYVSSVYTDDEVQYFIDGAVGNVTLAAAGLLFAWSADAAKKAKKESAAGGGGFGSVTLDLAVRSKELRESAKAYVDQYQVFENSGIPVEGLTEVGWTLESGYRLILRDIIRGTGI